jgi:hypothetical protein
LIYKQKVIKNKNIKIKNEIIRFNRYEFLRERFAKEISEFFVFSSVSGMEKQIKIIRLKHIIFIDIKIIFYWNLN